MYQSFEAPEPRNDTPARLKTVRTHMAKLGIDAYLVPRADAYQGEYVPPSAERLRWLTGFSGSAGIAVIGIERAAVFVDGRYTVQAQTEVDDRHFEIVQFPKTRPENWITETLPKTCNVIGFDPWLHTPAEIKRMRALFEQHAMSMKPIARQNLVDRAWGDARPDEPKNKVIVQPLKYAGLNSTQKLAQIQDALKTANQDAVILTLPDSICWLLNIRGTDIAHNPVALCYAIVPARGKAELFIAGEKLDAQARAHLKDAVRIQPESKLGDRLLDLKQKNKRVRLDPMTAAYWIEMRLKKSQISNGPDPCLKPKAIKNDAEIAGATAAHMRDGVALAQFLAWLDKTAPEGQLDEITVAKKLEQFRVDTGELRDISFDTISGSGPNGAIVHYRVTQATNRKLKRGELYLVYSGAQYQDGTTDVTRTIAIGEPTKQMRRHFTYVLKGHIAIATARFPNGTRGVDLDPFARRALWQAGLDFNHGTGHGVGSFLSVHEGPVSISRAAMVPLAPGMILSNEPGYYNEGNYGIRIENLVLVNEPETPKGGEREMLSFQTLTLAPIDKTLIDKSLLTTDEINWLDDYHKHVFKTLSSQLDTQTRAWLTSATKPL